jgi:hypothetical protein
LLKDAAKIVIIYYHHAAKYTISTKTNDDKSLIPMIMNNVEVLIGRLPSMIFKSFSPSQPVNKVIRREKINKLRLNCFN